MHLNYIQKSVCASYRTKFSPS